MLLQIILHPVLKGHLLCSTKIKKEKEDRVLTSFSVKGSACSGPFYRCGSGPVNPFSVTV